MYIHQNLQYSVTQTHKFQKITSKEKNIDRESKDVLP